MKKLLYILVGLFLVCLIGFFVLTFFLGSIVKGGVNKFGPQITQTKVELADAHISAFSGSGTLTNLFIGNPTGWQSDHAFSLGQIAISVEPRSVMGDHIIVNSVVIDRPDIIYETKITNSNLQDLLKNIQSNNTAEQPSSQTKQEKPVKIEIKTFRLLNAKITLVGAGQSLPVTMPTIALDDLGTREGGLTPPQLAAAIMKEVTAQAIQAGGKAVMEKGMLNKAGQGLQNLLGGKK